MDTSFLDSLKDKLATLENIALMSNGVAGISVDDFNSFINDFVSFLEANSQYSSDNTILKYKAVKHNKDPISFSKQGVLDCMALIYSLQAKAIVPISDPSLQYQNLDQIYKKAYSIYSDNVVLNNSSDIDQTGFYYVFKLKEGFNSVSAIYHIVKSLEINYSSISKCDSLYLNISNYTDGSKLDTIGDLLSNLNDIIVTLQPSSFKVFMYSYSKYVIPSIAFVIILVISLVLFFWLRSKFNWNIDLSKLNIKSVGKK